MIKKIFLVDDDADDREFFCEALVEVAADINCYTATNGRDALTMLDKKEAEIPDIIFLDVNMPVMSGWQCLTALKQKEEYKYIPVIMYSTSSHNEDVEKALQLGAVCFYTKPANFNDLKKGLEALLGQLETDPLQEVNLNTSAGRDLHND